MRYVPLSLVEPGMILGQDLYDGMGRMLLSKHLVLNEAYIKDLDDYGFPGIYIDDEFSEGIEIREVIRPEIKREALSLISNIFLSEDISVGVEARFVDIAQEIVESALDNADVMANMYDIKKYDDFTYFHSVNVGVLATMLGVRLNMKMSELKDLTVAAMLHDVGKRFMPLEILNKTIALNDDEIDVLRTHPRLGADFLRDKFNFSVYVIQGVMQHHEKYDGSGYPTGRSGEDIPLFARIIAIVDTYDALTSDRPNRPAYSNAEAIEYLMGSAGRRYDPEILKLFLHNIAVYPTGSCVELSDGDRAIVCENHRESVLRPTVKRMSNGEVVNLFSDTNARNITINRVVIK